MLKEIRTYGGQCPGSIFIDTVHSMSEVICDCGVLYNAVNELYRRLYDKDTKQIFVAFDEERCYFSSEKEIDRDAERAYFITGYKDEYGFFFDTMVEYFG